MDSQHNILLRFFFVPLLVNICVKHTTFPNIECRKAKYTEGGKLAGGVAIGMLGGSVGVAAATTACAVAFIPVTFGASIFACTLVGGGLGGWAGGEYGSKAGEYMGDVIYEYPQ